MTASHTPNLLRRSLQPLLLASGLALAGLGAVSAGDHGPRDPVAKMAERLDLDASQKASVEAIFERNRPAQQALRERHREHFGALRALDPKSADYSTQAQALADQAGTLARDRVLQSTQLRAELAAVLTPEQLAQLKAREHRGPRGHGGWHRKPGKERPDAAS